MEEDSSIAAGLAKVVLAVGPSDSVCVTVGDGGCVVLSLRLFFIRFAGGAGGRAPRIGESSRATGCQMNSML